MMQNYWLSTSYPTQLSAIIVRVIEGHRDAPISNVICLGIAGDPGEDGEFSPDGIWEFYPPDHTPWEQCDLIQFIIFSQITAQLAAASPGILNNLVVQDPEMVPEWKTMFENHGYRVVTHPEAFQELGETAFLLSFFVPPNIILE